MILSSKRITIILILCLILISCSQPFAHKVTIPSVDIYVCDDCSGHRGLAWPDKAEICTEGFMNDDGTITVTQEVLGHEILHIMHHFDDKIRHPHDKDAR